MIKKKRITKKTLPICIGTGLVALDVVLNGNPKTPPRIFAGGSCGNVISILSFLDWNSYPIARLKNNNAAKELIADFKKWNIKTDLITLTNEGSTPIIIQRIKKDKLGNPIHRFEFRNPENGEWLPSYKPVLGNSVDGIISKSPAPSTFYFDRINRASIELAKHYKKEGAIIFFEPSSIGEERLFEECLSIADIIKFSNERIPNYSQLYPKQKVLLEVETFGKGGLKYRYGKNLSVRKWTHVKPFKIGGFVDAAGAGDWCSAGIISRIGNKSISEISSLKKDELNYALLYGQALGGVNCCFDGARGIMYGLNRTTLDGIIKNIIKNKEFSLTVLNTKKIKNTKKNFKISSLI